MDLDESSSLTPELDLKYSELVESVQEYDSAITEYENAIETYKEVVSDFKNGIASPIEMKKAMDQFAYADDQLMDAAFELEDSVRGVQIEFSLGSQEDSIVPMATEHALAVQKIEETTENFSDTGYDFIKSLEKLEQLDDRIDTTVDIMERDEGFLSEQLEYSWDDAIAKASDYDTEDIDRIVEGFELNAKRKEVIQNSPNDRYIGGFKSKSGTEDLKTKRDEVLELETPPQEKRENVLGVNEEDLEKARNKVQERDPKYIH